MSGGKFITIYPADVAPEHSHPFGPGERADFRVIGDPGTEP